MVKTGLKFFGAVLAILTIVAVGVVIDQWTFLNRFLTIRSTSTVTELDWYRTVEIINGAGKAKLDRAAPGEETIDPDVLDAAEVYAAQKNSIALLVWHRGVLQRAWYADGFGPDTFTDPRSMHKSVLALVVGLAIEDGFIPSVDEPAATYLTEWAEDSRKEITIRHLLQMTSGLGRYPFEPSPFAASVQFNMGQNIAPYVLDIQPDRPPGEVFSYNNLNSQALGIILERATGERYADYLERRLWSRLPVGPARVVLDDEGGLARTYCCLQTTAEDWLQFGLLHLNKGKVGEEQVVPAEWMKEVTTPSDTNPNYGYQTWLGTVHEPRRSYGEGVALKVVQNEPFAATDVVYLDGADGQRVYVIPSEDLVVVRTGYGGANFSEGVLLWEDTELPNMIIRGIQQDQESQAPTSGP